jgi:hypothetical protein
LEHSAVSRAAYPQLLYKENTTKLRTGPKTFLLGLVDPEVRAAFGAYVRDVVRHPAWLFQPIYLQSVGIVQGPDMMPDGRADMSCRMDEWRLYGGYLSSQVQREQEQPDEVDLGERE